MITTGKAGKFNDVKLLTSDLSHFTEIQIELRLNKPLVSIALEYSGHAARQWNPGMLSTRQKFAQWPL